MRNIRQCVGIPFFFADNVQDRCMQVVTFFARARAKKICVGGVLISKEVGICIGHGQLRSIE